MKKTLICATALGLALTACDAPIGDTSNSAPDSIEATMASQVASAACVNPVPPRDEWLKEKVRTVDEVRESYASVGQDADESGVFKAYKAWIETGQNHDAAAKVFGDGYAKHAACWVN